MKMESVKLTEYSHGAGCGCKISPMLLDEILETSRKSIHYPQLLVGHTNKDDAASDKVPLLPNVEMYRQLGCIPGGARKNFASNGSKISEMTQPQREILCDAQTSGGLLVIVKKDGLDAFLNLTKDSGLALESIGETTARGEHLVKVK